MKDTIYRQDAIDCFWDAKRYFRDALDVVKDIRRLPSAPLSPCDVCIYNPPSSMDGKPCSMCPAEGRD